MSINRADGYECPFCGGSIEDHDLAGRCPNADAYGEDCNGGENR